LTGDIYLKFLQETLPELLKAVPLEVHREMWFQHDGAPAHCTEVVREYLDETFGNRWIGRGGLITWPPRSSYLTPLKIFLWGTCKAWCMRLQWRHAMILWQELQ
ncbi:hypothetical protein B7P43_G15539, partial [Cryptotermes secundus]